MINNNMELKCSICEKFKDVSEFSKQNNKKRGYSYRCKQCHNEYSRNKWYPNNKDKQIKASKTWRENNYSKYASYRYSINIKDIDLAFEKSNGKCEICGKMEKLTIDHCHQRNKFRGLLCNSCNLGLGHFKDDLETLKNAILYIEKFKNT